MMEAIKGEEKAFILVTNQGVFDLGDKLRVDGGRVRLPETISRQEHPELPDLLLLADTAPMTTTLTQREMQESGDSLEGGEARLFLVGGKDQKFSTAGGEALNVKEFRIAGVRKAGTFDVSLPRDMISGSWTTRFTELWIETKKQRLKIFPVGYRELGLQVNFKAQDGVYRVMERALKPVQGAENTYTIGVDGRDSYRIDDAFSSNRVSFLFFSEPAGDSIRLELSRTGGPSPEAPNIMIHVPRYEETDETSVRQNLKVLRHQLKGLTRQGGILSFLGKRRPAAPFRLEKTFFTDNDRGELTETYDSRTPMGYAQVDLSFDNNGAKITNARPFTDFVVDVAGEEYARDYFIHPNLQEAVARLNKNWKK
ncbi:MAG: hypothetical protein V1875_03720 [Candidatus Altiarchaeota archaeon]